MINHDDDDVPGSTTYGEMVFGFSLGVVVSLGCVVDCVVLNRPHGYVQGWATTRIGKQPFEINAWNAYSRERGAGHPKL